MLLIISAHDYTSHYVNFANVVKNNILEDSLFSRILYSTPTYTTNGLYLRNYTKEHLVQIENDILKAYNTTKLKSYSLFDHASNNSLLKISGVWESETAVGLAYKFSHLF